MTIQPEGREAGRNGLALQRFPSPAKSLGDLCELPSSEGIRAHSLRLPGPSQQTVQDSPEQHCLTSLTLTRLTAGAGRRTREGFRGPPPAVLMDVGLSWRAAG